MPSDYGRDAQDQQEGGDAVLRGLAEHAEGDQEGQEGPSQASTPSDGEEVLVIGASDHPPPQPGTTAPDTTSRAPGCPLTHGQGSALVREIGYRVAMQDATIQAARRQLEGLEADLVEMEERLEESEATIRHLTQQNNALRMAGRGLLATVCRYLATR